MIPMHLIVLALVPTIWVVDASNGPGTNFTDLPAAVAVSANGDTIIVRPGTYSGFSVAGKALTIRGAGASSTFVAVASQPGSAFGETTIDAVPQGTTFYLGGLRFAPIAYSGVPTPTSAALRITGPSRVALSDLVVNGAQTPSGTGTAALHLSNGAEVHASRSTFAGGAGTSGAGGHGAVVTTTSRLAAEASTFTGGPASPFFTAIGGAGVTLSGGVATLSRSSSQGGFGPASGGDAIRCAVGSFARVAGTASDVIQAGGSFAPVNFGHALYADPGCYAIVHGGVSVLPASAGGVVTTGSVTLGADALPYLGISGATSVAGELLASQPVTVTFEGAIPNAPFACVVDLNPWFSSAFGAFVVGELLVPVPTMVAAQGTLDGAGMAQTTFTPAATAPWLTDVPLYMQFGVFDAATGKFRMSNGPVRFFRN
jgi:hypothetical protein